jgi:tRNA threonylcarbamoyladenosine biosynthesis protein TsaE
LRFCRKRLQRLIVDNANGIREVKRKLNNKKECALLTLNLPAERDTRRLARVLAGCLPHTATVALYGPLGAGKTYLVRCLAQALHVQDNVSSPSYVLLHEYEGPVPMFHLDLYRLSSEEEVWELGLRDMIGRGLLVVEWPELPRPCCRRTRCACA